MRPRKAGFFEKVASPVRKPAAISCSMCPPHTNQDHRYFYDADGNFHSECLLDGCQCQKWKND